MSESTPLVSLISGIRVALCTTVIGCSGLISYFLLSKDAVLYMQSSLFTMALISVFSGAIRTGISVKKSGLLYGMILAILYIAGSLFIRNRTFAGALFSTADALTMVLLLLAGMTGGVIGVHLKSYLHAPIRDRLEY